MPRAPCESRGMEDLRMVRYLGPDGAAEHLGTYTAYDGQAVSLQLLRTSDFRTFAVAPLSGPGARNKGLALFPRQIGGRYVALSRADRESNAVTTSADLLHWETRSGSRRRAGRGRSFSWATAGRRSRPNEDGSCSPTASVRCAPTASGLCSWTWRTRPS